jgi:hypothetical protein
MGDWVIQIWEYAWKDKDYISLIFRFRDFWSNEVRVSKHKRVCYKRIFYATKLEKIMDDRKMLTPTRTITKIVDGRRLKKMGCC